MNQSIVILAVREMKELPPGSLVMPEWPLLMWVEEASGLPQETFYVGD